MRQEAAHPVEWQQVCLRRERREALIWTALATAFGLAWAATDWLLEPRATTALGGLRAADVVLGTCVLVGLRRTHDLRRMRLLAAIKLAATGSVIAVMLPLVQGSYWTYVFGLSLVFLGAAALFTLPLRFLAPACAAVALVLLGAQLAHPSQRTLAELVGTAAYLGTCIAVCLAVVMLRHKAQRSAFEASSALEQRNAELKQALVALELAQEEIVAAERHAAIGKLTLRIMHEVNNPLNVIANNLEPIEAYVRTLHTQLAAYREAEALLPDGGRALCALREQNEVDFAAHDVSAAIREMCEAAERIAGTYVSLVEFSKLSPHAQADADLSQSLKTTFALLRRALPSTLTIDARCDGLPAISVRHDDLGRALLHILQDTSSVMHDRGTIRVRTAVRSGVVELRVEHLEAAAAARVAELVEAGRADGELGLTASRDIIQRYGGSVELDPTSVRGAKLVIRVPIRSQPPQLTA